MRTLHRINSREREGMCRGCYDCCGAGLTEKVTGDRGGVGVNSSPVKELIVQGRGWKGAACHPREG